MQFIYNEGKAVRRESMCEGFCAWSDSRKCGGWMFCNGRVYAQQLVPSQEVWGWMFCNGRVYAQQLVPSHGSLADGYKLVKKMWQKEVWYVGKDVTKNLLHGCLKVGIMTHTIIIRNPHAQVSQRCSQKKVGNKKTWIKHNYVSYRASAVRQVARLLAQETSQTVQAW